VGRERGSGRGEQHGTKGQTGLGKGRKNGGGEIGAEAKVCRGKLECRWTGVE